MGQAELRAGALGMLSSAIQTAHSVVTGGDDPKELIERARARGFRFAMLFVEIELPENGGLSEQILNRVKNCIRRCDCVCIPRALSPSSEESGAISFAVLLENLRHDADAACIAERLGRELRQAFPFQIRGRAAPIRVGIALSSLTSAGPDDLLRHAAMAMQMARLNGNDTVEEARPSSTRNVPDSKLSVNFQVVRSDSVI